MDAVGMPLDHPWRQETSSSDFQLQIFKRVTYSHAMTSLRTCSFVLLASSLLSSGIFADEGAILFERVASGLANGVSDDGSIVVGQTLTQGFIWTLDGTTEIGGLAGIAASGDGTRITGDVVTLGDESAGRYTPGLGWSTFGGLGQSGCDSSLSSAYDISSDGSRCVGLGWNGCSAGAFLWTQTDGISALPQLGPNSSRADTISGDGTIIGGWDEASNGSRRAAIWIENQIFGTWSEVLVLLGTPGNGSGYGEVNGSNGDGSILVGSADGSSNSTSGAFVMRDGDQFELLGLLPPQQSPVTGGALDVTEDGSTIVGFQREGFGGAQTFEATIWTEATGYVGLKSYLNERGAGIPAEFTLAAAQSISDDGRVICGWGYEELFFFQEAWVVVLPPEVATCPADINGDDVVDGADLSLLLTSWQTSSSDADIDQDGIVGGSDLTLLLNAWGSCSR